MGLTSSIASIARSAWGSMFGTTRDQAQLDAWHVGMAGPPSDRINQNPYPPPFQNPQDLDVYSREASEMRFAYQRFYASEPTFQSAIDGKVASIAGLDVGIQPCDESSAIDKKAAEFCRDAIANCPGGFSGLIENILRPAFLTGFSITEKWLGGVDEEACFNRLRPKWNGLWAPRRMASIDTNYMRFQLDEARQITGVINTRLGLKGYSPDRVLIFTHRKLFENPYGRSDGRSAYRACQMIENAYKLWYTAIKNYAAPFLTVKTDSKGAILTALQRALNEARAGGWLTVSKQDEIELLNFASASSFQAFERKVMIARQEIYLAVRGSWLPFLEGSQQDGRGDSQVHKVASDAIESLLVQSACEVVNQQLIPDLVRPNFGDQCGLPTMTLGGTNWMETKTQLEVIRTVEKDLGRPVSTKLIYKISQQEPPRDDTDGPPPAPAPLALPPGQAPSPPYPFNSTAKFSGESNAVPVIELWTDPDRLQFKPFDGPDGLTKERRVSLDPYDANDGRKITAWMDPEKNRAYVVDGHGLLAQAKAANVKTVPVQWLPAKTADQARDMGRILNGGAAAQPAATFSDSGAVNKPSKPKPKAPIAGEDGQAAMRLAEVAMKDGRDVLESITADAVKRKISGETGPLFNPDELELLSEAIAASNATAELLGRYRIRERVANESAKRFAQFDEGTSPNRVVPLPPAKALDYFRSLMPSISSIPDFDERMRRTSFTLAVNTGEVILRQIQESIRTAISEGRTGASDVQDILDQAGVSSRNSQYSDLIMRTNVMDSYNVGHDEERQAPDVIDEFPAWEYLIVDDDRTGKDHRSKGGKYYPASVTFAEVRGDRPWNCRCSQRAINRREWARLQASGAKLETSW